MEKQKLEEDLKPKKIKEESRIRCPRCNSTFVYIRARTKEICCRTCGAVTKLQDCGENG